MNRTKIEWTDATLNPVVGCTHGCSYCYARRQAKRFKQRCQDCYDFKPHAHLERLEQLSPTQKPKRIFIDSMWDWNCTANDPKWLNTIIDKMWECSQHTFQILSKRVEGYPLYDFPPNCWLGVTLDKQSDWGRVFELDKVVNGNIRFASLEPLQERIHGIAPRVNWVIVGAETGNRKDKVVPKKEWVWSIIEECEEYHTPLFLKDNLHWVEEIKEFPSNDLKGESR